MKGVRGVNLRLIYFRRALWLKDRLVANGKPPISTSNRSETAHVIDVLKCPTSILGGLRGSGQASSEGTDSWGPSYHLQEELGRSDSKTVAHKQITLLLSSGVSNFKLIDLILETKCSREQLSGDTPSNRVEPSGLNEELTLSCFLPGRF